MSFQRLIYWSGLIGAWSAFVGWLFLEVAMGRWVDQHAAVAVVMATLVAIPIGGGISFASGLTNPSLPNLLKRLLLGLVGGLAGGLLGSMIGACVFSVLQGVPVLGFVSRVFGWTLIGMGIGVTEGIFDRSLRKVRNGLIGGGIGGFLAGLLFIPISFIIGSPISSRMVSFVLLGLFIGFAIGLAQVILKEAWLTVEQGFRPGRQVILGQDILTMGTSEKANLIFIAYGAKGVEPIHLKIAKQKDGGYLLEDNGTRTGTFLNGQAIREPTPLRQNDVIQLGVNVVRFQERVAHGGSAAPAPVVAVAAARPPAPMPAAKPAPNVVSPPPPKPRAPDPAPVKVAVVAATPKAKPAMPAARQEGTCPICGKKVIGVPNERRCAKCFTTF